MAWVGVVTNDGRAMLDSFASGGHELSIDSATVGTGTVADANLRIQTSVTGEITNASIVSVKEMEDGGTRYKIQIGPATASIGAYVAHQVGLWASLDGGSDKLLLLMQDSDTGISVPLESISPVFVFSIYAALAIDNTDDLTVNIDETAYVTVGTMHTALNDMVDKEAIANDLTISTAGKVLDARQGKVLKDLLDGTILIGPTTTIAAGTTTQALAGLTSNHRVIYWGFSSGGENNPPADITINSGSGQYSITVTNVATSGVTMTPIFIAPRN